MLALICGLTAACAWAVHDLLVRKIGQEAPILPMMLAVLAAGTVALVLPTALIAEWQLMTGPAYGFSAAAGLAYVLGISQVDPIRFGYHKEIRNQNLYH